MRIGILGAGAVAYGAAAYLNERGHEPVLWSPSGKRTAQLAAGQPLVASGAVDRSFAPHIASSCADAIASADAIMIALPANGHKTVIDAAAPHIRHGQPVIVSGHLSFGALYLSKRLAARNVRAPIGRLIEALDTERLNIARTLGLAVKTVQEHFALSYRVPIGGVSDMNQERHRLGLGGFGPNTIETRYVLEDVPFGLVPMVLLARRVGSRAILHESGIALLSAAYGRDFARENDLLPELDLDGLTVPELQRLARDGYP